MTRTQFWRTWGELYCRGLGVTTVEFAALMFVTALLCR